MLEIKAQTNQVAQLNLTLVNPGTSWLNDNAVAISNPATGAGAGKNHCDVSQHYPERRGQKTQINLRHAASLAT